MTTKRFLILSAALLSAAVQGAFRPAGTVTFADLPTIAAQVAAIGKSTADPLLSMAVPSAIRNQGAAKLFGPMRKGFPGVAVCYVDEAAVARLMATAGKQGASVSRRREQEFDRAKFWTVFYPLTTTKAVFLSKHPDAVQDAGGVVRIPPGHHSRRTLYAFFTADGKWVALAPSASLAAHTPTAATPALTPLNGDLAHIKMDPAGAHAMFHSTAFSGGTVSIRMTPAGLEIRGAVKTAIKALPPLAPNALAFAGAPQNAALFGVSSIPDDLRSTDVFTLLGADLGTYIRKTSVFKLAPGANVFFLAGDPKAPPADLRARLLKILPEAKRPGASNVMFASPTQVLKTHLPLFARTLMPADSVKAHAALRMLRNVRGDGLGFMGWREGNQDKFLIRISRDELWGTSMLWSTMFL